MGRGKRRASVFDIFDYTQETCDYYAAIFDGRTLDPCPELRRLFKGEVWPGNTLILDRLEIMPEFRGYNLGLAVMPRLIERFGAGAGVVAIKPFPLQRELTGQEEDKWRQKMRGDDFEQNLPRATARLRRHYVKLGFTFMKGTPFMFRNAQIALPAPHKLVPRPAHDKHPPKTKRVEERRSRDDTKKATRRRPVGAGELDPTIRRLQNR